jgi:hypothetical protein
VLASANPVAIVQPKTPLPCEISRPSVRRIGGVGDPESVLAVCVYVCVFVFALCVWVIVLRHPPGNLETGGLKMIATGAHFEVVLL